MISSLTLCSTCRVEKESMDLRDPRENLGSQERLAHRESLDLQEFPEMPVEMDSRAALDCQEIMENK